MLIFIYNFFLKTKNLIYKVFIKENIYSINTVLLQNLFESATYLFIYTQWITHTTHTDRQIVEIYLFIYLFIYLYTNRDFSWKNHWKYPENNNLFVIYTYTKNLWKQW